MRAVCLLVLIAMLASRPGLAQSASGSASGSGATDQDRRPAHSPGPPLDRGPYTPEANRAYQGGGMILQGAPGAPAPTPAPTPPGQTPRGMVPAR